MSKYRRRALETLKRRITFLTGKARHDYSPDAASWARQEIAALEWAIGIVEAAQTVGSIDELEMVAAIEPDPEAWARRGEVVDGEREEG